MSVESALIKELEGISKEIDKATIVIKEPSSKMMRYNPFISLEISNKLFPLWKKQHDL